MAGNDNTEATAKNARAETTASPPYCVFVNYLPAFKIPLGQIVFLNWCTLCAVSYGFKPFYHAKEAIMRETKLSRREVQAARDKFFAMGFLHYEAQGIKTHSGTISPAAAKLTYYEMDFSKLKEKLPDIIDKEAAPEYYQKWEAFCASCIRHEAPHGKKAERLKAGQYFAVLEKVYNERICIYNETAKERKPNTALARNPQRTERLYRLTEAQGWQGVRNAFIAFADYVIKNGSGRQQISPVDYFLKQEGAKWPVFEYFLNYYNANYVFSQ